MTPTCVKKSMLLLNSSARFMPPILLTEVPDGSEEKLSQTKEVVHASLSLRNIATATAWISSLDP